MLLFHNPNLAERVRPCTALDRFVQGVDAKFEQVFTLGVQTDPLGVVHVFLCLDMIRPGRDAVYGTLLAMYPLTEQAHAQEDGLLLSRKYELSLRRATPGVGWQWVRQVGVPEPATEIDFKV